MSRVALSLVGAWLGALIASWVAATVNFRTVERVLGADQSPELAERLAPVPPEARRQVLRHLASEINRWVFDRWSLVQTLLGTVLLALVWRSGGVRWLAAGALALVLVQALTVGPIVELGRSIDFVPRPLPPATARRFGLLHAAYVGLDLAKASLLLALAGVLFRRPVA